IGGNVAPLCCEASYASWSDISWELTRPGFPAGFCAVATSAGEVAQPGQTSTKATKSPTSSNRRPLDGHPCGDGLLLDRCHTRRPPFSIGAPILHGRTWARNWRTEGIAGSGRARQDAAPGIGQALPASGSVRPTLYAVVTRSTSSNVVVPSRTFWRPF